MNSRTLNKAVSILTILTFLLTNTNIGYGAPSSRSLFKDKKIDYDKISSQQEDTLQKKQSVIKGEDAKEVEAQDRASKKILQANLSDISQIHIPQEMGRIVEVYQSPDSETQSPLIVGIQDLHTNPEAELNLAKILDVLLKDYKMGLVCSEGADGVVDTSRISSFPDTRIKEKVSRIFIDSGELTGEEYLSITKYPDLPIWGVEDKDVYFKNIIGFNKIMKFNPDSQRFISQTKKAVEELKPRIYSKELIELDKKELEFSSQKLDTAEYIKYLLDFANMINSRDRSKNITAPTIPKDNTVRAGIKNLSGEPSREHLNISNYKNISLLTETMEMEKHIDQLKIAKDSQNLLLNLQSILMDNDLKIDLDNLKARANLFNDQKSSPFSFYSYLKDLALKHIKDGFAAKYPELNKFIDYLTKVNSVDSTKLFLELENLNFEIKENIAKTNEEKLLIKASRNINFLENFFNLKVSNEDLDYYLNNKDEHKVAFFKDFLKPTLSKYNINAVIDYNPALIDSHFQELEDFYKVVKDRDIAMVNNSISEITKRNVKLATLVHGGFHTKGITKLLREKGYSYIIVSPYSKTDMDEENYHFLLSGKRKPITELMQKLDLSKIIENLLKPAPETLRVALGFNPSVQQTYEAMIPQFAQELGVSEDLLRSESLINRMNQIIGVEALEVNKARNVAAKVLEHDPKAVILKFVLENGTEKYIKLTKKDEKTVDVQSADSLGNQMAGIRESLENLEEEGRDARTARDYHTAQPGMPVIRTYEEHEKTIDALLKLAHDPKNKDWIEIKRVDSINDTVVSMVYKFLYDAQEEEGMMRGSLTELLKSLIEGYLTHAEGKSVPGLFLISIHDSKKIPEGLRISNHASDRGIHLIEGDIYLPADFLHEFIAFLGQPPEVSVAFDVVFQFWRKAENKYSKDIVNDKEAQDIFKTKLALELGVEEWNLPNITLKQAYEQGIASIKQILASGRQPELLAKLSQGEQTGTQTARDYAKNTSSDIRNPNGDLIANAVFNNGIWTIRVVVNATVIGDILDGMVSNYLIGSDTLNYQSIVTATISGRKTSMENIKMDEMIHFGDTIIITPISSGGSEEASAPNQQAMRDAKATIGGPDAAMALAFSALSKGLYSEFNRHGGSAGIAGLEKIIETSSDDVAKAIAYSRLVNSTQSGDNPYGGPAAVEALEAITKNSDSDTAKALAHKRLAEYYSFGTNISARMNAIEALEFIADNSGDEVAKAIACCYLRIYYSTGTNYEKQLAYKNMSNSLYNDSRDVAAKAIIAAFEDYQIILSQMLYRDKTISLFAKAIAAEYLSRKGYLGQHNRGAALIKLEEIIDNAAVMNAIAALARWLAEKAREGEGNVEVYVREKQYYFSVTKPGSAIVSEQEIHEAEIVDAIKATGIDMAKTLISASQGMTEQDIVTGLTYSAACSALAKSDKLANSGRKLSDVKVDNVYAVRASKMMTLKEKMSQVRWVTDHPDSVLLILVETLKEYEAVEDIKDLNDRVHLVVLLGGEGLTDEAVARTAGIDSQYLYNPTSDLQTLFAKAAKAATAATPKSLTEILDGNRDQAEAVWQQI